MGNMCKVDGCIRESAYKRGGLCHMHHKRRFRGIPQGQTPKAVSIDWAHIMELAIRIGNHDSDNDEEFYRLEQQFKMATILWAGRQK